MSLVCMDAILYFFAHVLLLLFCLENYYAVSTKHDLPMYQFTLATDREYFIFSLKACEDAYVILTTVPGITEDNSYHIVMGAQSNSMTEIHKQSPQSETKSFSTQDILSCSEMRPFWIRWVSGSIELGTGDDVGSAILFAWRDMSAYEINSISLASKHTENAHWEFDEDSSEYCLSLHRN